VTSVYNPESKTVYINVINRHKDKVIAADILSISGDFQGKAEATVFNSGSLDEPFTFEKQTQYVPVVKEIKTEKNKLYFSFPAHSITQIKAIVKNM
jgi:alpha-N-arabinofuranosidase